MKKIFLLIILTLIFHCPSQLFAGEDEEYQAVEHYNNGVSYHKQGYVDSALNEYKKAISFNPGLSEAYYNLGIIYAERKNYSEAATMFKKVAEIKPDNYEAHYNLGIMYSESDSTDSAIYELEKAISLDANQEQAHLALGSIYAKNKQNEKAIFEFRKAYTINPSNYKLKEVLDEYDRPRYVRQTAPAQTNTNSSSGSGWGGLLILVAIFGWKFFAGIFRAIAKRAGKYYSGKKSISEFFVDVFQSIKRTFTAIRIRVRNPVERVKRIILQAETRKQASDYQGAQALCREAIKILTSEDVVFLNNSLKKGIFQSPAEIYELRLKACRLFAKTAYLTKKIAIVDILSELKKVVFWDHSLSYVLGELLYIQNDFRGSLDCFIKVANEKKGGELVNLWLGILNYKLANYKKGLALLETLNVPVLKSSIQEECLFDNPTELSINCLRYKALCCYAIKDWRGVIKHLELAKAEYGIDSDLSHYLSRAYLNANNYLSALNTIDECIKAEPNDQDLIIDRARICRYAGKLVEAEEGFREALSIRSEDSRIYYELAMVCSLKGSLNDAIVCFNKALQLKQDDVQASYKRGIVYEKNNKQDKAIESYLFALKFDEGSYRLNTRIGISFCKQGKYGESLPYFEKAYVLGDTSNQNLYFSGLAYVNTGNLNAGLSKWEKINEREEDFNEVLGEKIRSLKDLIVNKEKYLYGELHQEFENKNWHKAYGVLSEIKKATTDRNSVVDCLSYVRNRLLPEFLKQNKRIELSEILRSGLKDNPTNYSLLHNASLHYYWWTIDSDQKCSRDIHEYKLWENLIGYWTAIVNNDEFWDKWTKQKTWIKKIDVLELKKIRNNLMSNLETKIFSSMERNRLEDKHDNSGMYRDALKKLHVEKKFASYYRELKDILSEDISVIPDMYSETLIRDLGMQNYINELADMGIQKQPDNEKIKKIKYFLSPFRYIAILVEEENYEAAIKEIDNLPINCRNDAIVSDLMNLAKLKLGAAYLQNDNATNHILRAEKIWSECQISNNGFALSIIELSAVESVERFKKEHKIEIAIRVGEVALKFIPENKRIKIVLSGLFNERGVEKWNSGLVDFGVNGGVADLEKALEYNSQNFRAKKNLSIMYCVIGWKYVQQKEQRDDIKDLFEKALALDADNENAKKGLAVIGVA